MRPSKWLVFIRPSLAGFDRPLTLRVTNRIEPVLALWRDYNGRAAVEQRIEELKNDLSADDFCTQNF